MHGGTGCRRMRIYWLPHLSGFLEQGYDVVAADNLCNSSAESLRRVEELTGKKIPFYEVNVCDRAAVRPILKTTGSTASFSLPDSRRWARAYRSRWNITRTT